MKSLITKLFAFIFVIMLSVSCASSITAPQDLQTEKKVQKQDKPNPGDITTGDGDMNEHVEKPM